MAAYSQYTDSESVFKNHLLTFDLTKLRVELERDGWRTPQTYCGCFAEVGDFPAVYMFLLVDDWSYKTARPAYVGMSTRLSRRWIGHSVLAELQTLGPWVQKWFLRVPKADLRRIESKNIRKFDPPWNVNGRKRGVAAL